MTAKTKYSQEFLSSIFATDTTERVIPGFDSVELACNGCQGEKKTIKMSQIMDKYRKMGFGWRCATCYKKAHSGLMSDKKSTYYRRVNDKDSLYSKFKDKKEDNPTTPTKKD